MHLPKYSNPHLIADATRVISRKTLQLQGGADGDVELDGEADGVGLDREEVENLHIKLDKIVSKRLKLKRAPPPSDEPYFNKRRKTLVKEGEEKPDERQQHSEPVAFRLISTSLPPRAIHLFPKPPKVMPVKEPPCEDTEQELEERAYRSALSAVDLDQIRHIFSMVNDSKPPRLLQTTSHLRGITSPLLLLEVSPIAPLPPPWINPRLRVLPKPSPHELSTEGSCCPVIFAGPHYRHDREKKGKRRREKPKNKNKLVP